MTIGFDQYGETVIEAGSAATVKIWPQRMFRGDFLYFETEGLIIQRVQVGNYDQPIFGVPSSYYKERETEESMKGRPVRFKTAEVGMVISFLLFNPTSEPLAVRGCIEGKTIL